MFSEKKNFFSTWPVSYKILLLLSNLWCHYHCIGSCFLQFWNHKPSIRRCKCPMCSQLISQLTPEACLLSRHEKEVRDVLKNVHKYNSLFQGGFRGLLQVELNISLNCWGIAELLILDPCFFVSALLLFSLFDWLPSFFELFFLEIALCLSVRIVCPQFPTVRTGF